MGKILSAIFLALMAMNMSSVQAATLTPDVIKTIHDEIKPAFAAKCMSSMDGATQAICDCLAAKAETNLDDDILKKCENANTDASRECISNVVAAATEKALEKESIRTCLPADQQTQTPPAVSPSETSAASPVTSAS